MDDQFLPHNFHWQSIKQFIDFDPQLRKLSKQIYVHTPSILQKLPIDISGIYTLGGGRQIGKTTLLKQWMRLLLEKNINPESIFFLTGEIIYDHLSLIQIIKQYIEHLNISSNKIIYIIVDEITYIKNWDQGVKYLADTGILENVQLVLTGSDLTFIQEARMRFPGRRGNSDVVDFHLYPLSFFEFVHLKLQTNEEPSIDILFQEFDNYLYHGGFLTAINDQAKNENISSSTYQTYSDWIRGDVIKHGKSEAYLREFLMASINTYGTQVTWNSLADHTSIDHPNTIQEYANFLASMDVLFVQNALIENKLLAAPKKAKKLIFKDPFIFHAIQRWINPFRKPDSSMIPALVESCVISHYQRFYPTFYIKAEGEVDLAYVDENTFHPIEVKWTKQLRSKDLKQIKKYKNGLILSQQKLPGLIETTPTVPLPQHLYQLGFTKKTPQCVCFK
ncbi:MAG: ATP-binding protein [Alphaproteobacteria bacterium]|nr:ATP-binding protein [Alphaproteobacteria bacterium]